jgi:hypothetical protein
MAYWDSLLAAYFRAWRYRPTQMRTAPPSLVFAVIGQAKANGQIGPEEESHLLANLLTYWALHRALDMSAACAAAPVTPITAPVT